MSSLMIWYEQLGGREQSEHVESIDLWERVWTIGDKVFSLYHGWGEIKTIWRLHRASGDKKHEWRCNVMFLSGEFENESLYGLNIWMTEDSFASERGERRTTKNTARSVTHGTSICVCDFCGEGFKSNRAHARTCSPKCRKALSRREKA